MDIPAHRDFFEDVISIANGILASLEEPLEGSPVPILYPNGAPHIPDSRIQLSLEDVEFVLDPVGWNNASSACGSYLYSKYGNEDCYYDVFWVEDNNTNGYNGCGLENYCTIIKAYANYINPLHSNHFWAYDLLHEMGHSFGLSHSWHGQFADVNTSNTTWCDPWVDAGCVNNIMSYAYSRKRNFTPHQLSAIHSRMFTDFNSPYLKHDYNPSGSITITGDETWTNGRTPTGDIIIKPGGKLEIQCKVMMTAGSKIVVQKGGQLIVNGGHITTNAPKCDGYWDGIIVEGDPGTFTLANQGYVLLQNDALIELANTGIRVKDGGVVRGFASTIRDCRYGLYYDGFPRSARYNINRNYFDGCYFGITDQHVLDINGLVTLNNLGGLNFNSCQFKDERTEKTEYLDAEDQRTIGVQSNSARFRIGGSSLFEGLFLGISAGATGLSANQSYSVRQTEFKNCYGGIVSRGINNAVIIDNDFTLGGYEILDAPNDGGGASTHNPWDGFGISIQSGTSYKIEDNEFFRADLYDANLGIYINNSGTAYNQILNNKFTSITVGNYAEGLNGALFPTRNGLEYLCNHNTIGAIGAAFDFYVAPGGDVRRDQGKDQDPAGNIFRFTGSATDYHFANAADSYELNYFYYTNAQPPYQHQEPEEYTNLDKIPVDESPNCGDNSNEDDKETLKPNERLAREAEFVAARDAFVQAHNTYMALIDNGDTDALTNQIQSVFGSGNTMARLQLIQTLQSLSPYLSPMVFETVAAAGINKNTLLSLAQANPESIKHPDIITKLTAAQGLTEAEAESLKTGAQQSTSRTDMENDLSEKQKALHLVGLRLLIAANADSAGYSETYTQNILAQSENLSYYYQLADRYRNQGNLTGESEALAKAADWLFTDFDLKQHQAYFDLRSLVVQLQASGRDWYQATSSELSDLHTLANADAGIATATARQIINMTQGQTYLKLPPIPVSITAQRATLPGSGVSAYPSVNDLVQAYPNPAYDWVTFHLKKKATESTVGRIQVFDNQQRLIYEQVVPAGVDKLNWQPGTDLASGIYFYRYLNEAQVSNLRKLLLLR